MSGHPLTLNLRIWLWPLRYGRAMRSFLAASAILLMAACTPELGIRSADPSPVSSAETLSPADWVMTPDSFGPITMATTRSEALSTGAYVAAPSPCAAERLDWDGQTYESTDADVDDDGEPDRTMVKPYLGTITFGDDDRPAFIDPGKNTVTDRGIRKSDSLSRLQLEYGEDLIPGRGQSPGIGTFAVNGDRGHLLYEVMYGKVVGFYVAAGTVKGPQDVEVGRFMVNGTVTKPDKMPMGHAGDC